MIPTAITLLLVSDDPAAAEVFRRAVERADGARLLIARSSDEAVSLLLGERPQLVIAASTGPGTAALELCARLRAEDGTAAPRVIRLVDRSTGEPEGLETDAAGDDFLATPPWLPEVRARLRDAVRLRRLKDELREEVRERERLQAIVDADREEWLKLLATQLDIGLPGAQERGQRLAAMALALAGRFGVPERLLPDLEIAARLHELGRLAMDERVRRPGDVLPQYDAWRYTQSTQVILNQSKSLEKAAELVGSLYENWDGTGHPDHLLQGQIPLRCRILRVLVDLFDVMTRDDAPSPLEVAEELAEHAGTRYDPMVVVHLRGLLGEAEEGAARGDKLLVPIHDLRAGMVLAEDLFTNSGLKLVARDTRLTASTLEAILARHQSDPILRGAAVRRATAA